MDINRILRKVASALKLLLAMFDERKTRPLLKGLRPTFIGQHQTLCTHNRGPTTLVVVNLLHANDRCGSGLTGEIPLVLVKNGRIRRPGTQLAGQELRRNGRKDADRGLFCPVTRKEACDTGDSRRYHGGLCS